MCFRTSVMHELDGHAKAMVVTESRAGAVKYRQAFEDYVTKKGYKDIKALVAFSGKVTIDGKDYTEVGMNGFSEKSLPDEFDKDNYQVLLVADKYQTGFDQPKLCAMYILKKLHGVTAVQTLSRLNRICPPYEKKTFVLDFANDYEDKMQCSVDIRHFIRFYEFLIQVSCFEDVELHKKYNFLNYLISYINIKHPGGGYNLDGKIKATTTFRRI